ncbi:MAG: methyltransferase [Lachnospiraceae bacterium]|nr:methyltransferase [Lachnospiraceae bacterium]
MNIPAFDESERKIIGKTDAMRGLASIPVFNAPCSVREAVRATYRREPVWQTFSANMKIMTPQICPDNVARAYCFEAQPFTPILGPVKDMFGIEWEYVPQVGGSMVRPGHPFAEDMEELLEKVQWPDIDSWDWEGSAKANNGVYFRPDTYNVIVFMNGWFERLISMMEFENALMALNDEDEQELIHQFFDKLTDLYIDILGRYIDTYDYLDGFSIHDDWGGQLDTFFPPALSREMIVPYMRRVTDYIHSRGLTAELHSCGQNLKQVPNYIEAGWDSWCPQAIVDSQKVYELYGDKILLGVDPKLDLTGKTDDEARQAARDYVDRFMQPGKPCLLHSYTLNLLTDAFWEELYVYSRKKGIEMAQA